VLVIIAGGQKVRSLGPDGWTALASYTGVSRESANLTPLGAFFRADGVLRIVFARVRSLTARGRNDLVGVVRKGTADHLLVLASD
jgi:hypothetical protein